MKLIDQAARDLPLDGLLSLFINNCKDSVDQLDSFRYAGRVIKVTGLVIEALGVDLPVGSICIIPLNDGKEIEAEVVGFDQKKLFLMPQGSIEGIAPDAKVYLKNNLAKYGELYLPKTDDEQKQKQVSSHLSQLPVGDQLLGRVLDASGNPLDGLGPLKADSYKSLQSEPINPLRRAPIDQILDVGVRAINSLLTVGRGQRMGLFAGSGVGKSILLGMMARYTDADVIVVGLIGERGREVKEFIESILGEEGLKRSVVVAAPADESPLMRMQGANYSSAIAEYFRDQGKHVLLIMDSLTRFSMAQREIALAIGEPPATKGYPPSVFAKLPKLVERAGNSDVGGGSITAFYTVLTEGDDQQDPIADAARSILDGHIVLDRTLAEAGHYPAINVEQSISRVMHSIIDPAHQDSARKIKQLNAKYSRNLDLINVGAYVGGADSVLDEAIKKHTAIELFLKQDLHVKSTLEESIEGLHQINTAQL
ncbi:flagellar protein export ATPase FliI [Polynucleobacter paneuropaeus]|nr:flagellar protein export ATPase FliI [Polynucleobacter paneuropaeus]